MNSQVSQARSKDPKKESSLHTTSQDIAAGRQLLSQIFSMMDSSGSLEKTESQGPSNKPPVKRPSTTSVSFPDCAILVSLKIESNSSNRASTSGGFSKSPQVSDPCPSRQHSKKAQLLHRRSSTAPSPSPSPRKEEDGNAVPSSPQRRLHDVKARSGIQAASHCLSRAPALISIRKESQTDSSEQTFASHSSERSIPNPPRNPSNSCSIRSSRAWVPDTPSMSLAWAIEVTRSRRLVNFIV
mmetsp:Transcript_31015/g.73959  ORF Transcript_31015/g.73959 Transcript_31015/m.73959 type:complete len:241 (-) Transcript_31015:251-973(-)